MMIRMRRVMKILVDDLMVREDPLPRVILLDDPCPRGCPRAMLRQDVLHGLILLLVLPSAQGGVGLRVQSECRLEECREDSGTHHHPQYGEDEEGQESVGGR